MLTAHSYPCSDREEVALTLHDGIHMSVTALHEENGDTVDLRDHVSGDVVTWRAPYGNWTVTEYNCVPDYESRRVNILSYDSSIKYIRAVWSLFADIFEPYIGNVLTMLCYRHLCYGSRNRRDWDDDFNEKFRERYGFDPAPYYPALFDFAGNDTNHYKALFFDCRAHMLREGFLRAASDFAEEIGLSLFGNISEPKLSQCSPITGDAMLDNSASPCGVFERAYLYGMNSVKVAAGAAFGIGHYDVGCEPSRRRARDRTRRKPYRDASAAALGEERGADGYPLRLRQTYAACAERSAADSGYRGHIPDILAPFDCQSVRGGGRGG